MKLVQPGILLSLSLLLLRAGALAETGTRGDKKLEFSADIAVANSNEMDVDDDPCTISEAPPTATVECATTITAPVVITDTIDGNTLTRTVTNGDHTSFPVPPCPTAGDVTITEIVNGQTYTRTVTNGDHTSFPTPTTGPVVITETINDQIHTLTVTDGAHTSFSVPCSDCSACPTPTTVSATTTTSAMPTPTACPCTGAGSYCGSSFDASCGYSNETLFDCSATGAYPTVNTEDCPNGCVQQDFTAATCMVDCQANLHLGVYYDSQNGTILRLNPSTGTTTLLFDSNGTGSVNEIAVNTLQTEYKSNFRGQVFKAQPGENFTAAPNLNNPTNLEWNSFGARQDGVFMMASIFGKGKAYYFPANSTAPPAAVIYTDLPGNAITFCGNIETCFADLAFDGNDYLWVITGRGGLFISTTPQTTTLGGNMKYIGQLQVDGVSLVSPKVSAGLAFDAFGNIYYSGGTHLGGLSYNGGYVSKASISNPLVSTTIYSSDAYVIDLATCAYPTIDSSDILD